MITEETKKKIDSFQPRCIVCGSTKYIQTHHRIFISEQYSMQDFLKEMAIIYEQCYNRKLILWLLDDIQNLANLCLDHHEGGGIGVHGGNEKLRQQLKHSFTCPITGFNIPYYKVNSLY